MGRHANPNLTLGEEEVLHLLAQGRTLVEIGSDLGIGKKAAEWRAVQIKQKLHAKTLPHAVSEGYQKGILIVNGGDDEHSRNEAVHDHAE